MNANIDNTVQANTLTDDANGVFVSNASLNLIGGMGAGTGNVITNNSPSVVPRNPNQVGVYIFGGGTNTIARNTITGMGGYGILLFNTPPNADVVFQTGPNRNIVTRSGSADFRVFNGPVQVVTKPSTSKGKRRVQKTAWEAPPEGPRTKCDEPHEGDPDRAFHDYSGATVPLSGTGAERAETSRRTEGPGPSGRRRY